MKDGTKVCPFCSSSFTFEAYELVDARPAEQPCGGCERLYAILAESARRKAAMKEPEPAPAVDLSSAGILKRLEAMRKPAEVRDWARAAAGERE